MLALDLGVFNRKTHVIQMKEALLWTSFWVTLAFPVEDAEIQRQHRQNEHPKEDPPSDHDICFLCLQ